MQPIVLIVLDGFGMSPISEGNAVMSAKTPFLDWAIAAAPKALLHASGAEVGLDWGEMGNSEVGHFNLGTGRIVMQDLPRINRAIEDGSFFTNQVMLELAETTKKHGGRLHVIGLASSGGVHAHLDHMLAMLEFAHKNGIKDVALHLISDGRDTQPKALGRDLPQIQAIIDKYKVGVIASVSGRYYAMDRDKRWDRTALGYRAIVDGTGRLATDMADALAQADKANETDEFITPTVLTDSSGKPLARIQKNDTVLFTNYRPDRARQLAAALTFRDFRDFDRGHEPVKFFVSLSSYGQEATPAVKVAFFAQPVTDQLAAVIAKQNLAQFHLAETEKYAHVTYFLNGGAEKAFPGEERVMVASPKVATYDLQPEMSAGEITVKFLNRLKRNPPMLSVINFANPDMVGHTGNLKMTVKAVETVDQQINKILLAAQKIGATVIVTADHGNAEQLIHPETHEMDKEHTTNPVPFFLIPPECAFSPLASEPDPTAHLQFAAQPPVGVLADVAPTILDCLGLEKPAAMTGQSLRGLV